MEDQRIIVLVLSSMGAASFGLSLGMVAYHWFNSGERWKIPGWLVVGVLWTATFYALAYTAWLK